MEHCVSICSADRHQHPPLLCRHLVGITLDDVSCLFLPPPPSCRPQSPPSLHFFLLILARPSLPISATLVTVEARAEKLRNTPASGGTRKKKGRHKKKKPIDCSEKEERAGFSPAVYNEGLPGVDWESEGIDSTLCTDTEYVVIRGEIGTEMRAPLNHTGCHSARALSLLQVRHTTEELSFRMVHIFCFSSYVVLCILLLPSPHAPRLLVGTPLW